MTLRRLTAVCLVAALLSGPAEPVPSVAVILLDNRPEYMQALDGFEASYDGPITIYTTDPLPDPMPEDYVVAFGSRSADKTVDLSLKKPTVLSMVLDVGNPLRYRVSGVRLLVEPKEVITTLKQILPTIRTVGVFSTPETPKDYLAQVEKAAKDSRLGLVKIEVGTEKEILTRFLRNVGKIDVLWLIPDPLIGKGELIRYLLERSLQNFVPVIGSNPGYIRQGALFTVSPDFRQIGKQTADILKEVVAGKKPGVVAPANTVLTLNSRVADVLRIKFPKAITDRAAKSPS